MAEAYRVTYSLRAEEDLNGIVHYLMNEHSRLTASSTYLTIKEKITQVSNMPSAYPPYVLAGDRIRHNYRYTIAKKRYRIVFTVKEVANTLRIVRIANIKEPLTTTVRSLEEE